MGSLVHFLLGLATSFTSLSTAHTVFTTLFINDVNQGDGTCIRMARDGRVCTHPIAGLDSSDLACGRDGQDAVAFTCPAPAGAKVTLEFRAWADASQPGAIDKSHLGTTAIYLKPVFDINTDSAAGPGWFKIWAEGYDPRIKQWATEKLISTNGLLSINLPSALPTGYYLVRSEIITLQNVTNDLVDPQIYVGCAQLFIQGRDDAGPLTVPADKVVSIPGHLKASDPGLTYNIYTSDPLKNPYPVPGPEPFFPAGPSLGNRSTKEDNKRALPWPYYDPMFPTRPRPNSIIQPPSPPPSSSPPSSPSPPPSPSASNLPPDPHPNRPHDPMFPTRPKGSGNYNGKRKARARSDPKNPARSDLHLDPHPRAQAQPPAGLVPPTCLLKNANWCGVEVPRYTTEAGCWAASADCFAQLEACYAGAPPTGSRGCRAWEARKCAPIQEACRSGGWVGGGPPDEGRRVSDEGVDVAVPGGGKIPEAVNAGADAGGGGGGGGGGEGEGEGEGEGAAWRRGRCDRKARRRGK